MTTNEAILVIYTLLTAVIAFYAWKNHQLNKQVTEQNRILRNRDEEFRQQTADLYQAIVIATLISGPSGYELDNNRVLDKFRSLYKGKHQIFSKE